MSILVVLFVPLVQLLGFLLFLGGMYSIGGYGWSMLNLSCSLDIGLEVL
jgi:hypothetical protein